MSCYNSVSAVSAPSKRFLGRLHGHRCLFALVACLALTGCSGSSNSSSAKKVTTDGSASNPKTVEVKGPEAKLVGVWVGSIVLPNLGADFGKVRFEIKANGRYSLTGLTGVAQIAFGATPRAGTWEVTGSEGNVVLAKVTNDLAPENVIGWRITVKGDDDIVLEDVEGTMTLKRKKPVETIQTPFGVGASPEGADVEAFAQEAQLPADQTDHNAPDWPGAAGAAPADLDGEWSSRWNNTTSPQLDQAGEFGVWRNAQTTEVKTVAGKVFVLVQAGQTSYLMVLLRDGNQLRGRYIGVGNPNEPGLFAGVVVDNQRIDGVWTGADEVGGGRWDLRR